jgi:hypothetical protein
MNVEIGTEVPIFLFWEYLFRNFGILYLQCRFGSWYRNRGFTTIRLGTEDVNIHMVPMKNGSAVLLLFK